MVKGNLAFLLLGLPNGLAAVSFQDASPQGYVVVEATILELQDDMATGRGRGECLRCRPAPDRRRGRWTNGLSSVGIGVAAASGQVTLGHSHREALTNGRLYLRVYTRDHPAGAARGRLLIPSR